MRVGGSEARVERRAWPGSSDGVALRCFVALLAGLAWTLLASPIGIGSVGAARADTVRRDERSIAPAENEAGVSGVDRADGVDGADGLERAEPSGASMVHDGSDASDETDVLSEAEEVEAEEPDPLFDDAFDEELDAAPKAYPDPAESTNRGVFAFNRQVDKWILDPVTRAYQWAVPKPARNAISRFFLNLGSTKTLVNDCLQLEWKDAGITATRLVVNTTVGLAGLFDVAERLGMPGHESDFGQTLALAGTPSGPYLMLPVLGPSDLRDGFGVLIDGFFQPTYYILGPMNVTLGPVIMQSPGAILIYGGSSGLTLRDRNFAKLKDLESSSVDFYAALRSGFYQDRVGQIWGRRTGHRTDQEPGSGEGNAAANDAEGGGGNEAANEAEGGDGSEAADDAEAGDGSEAAQDADGDEGS